MDNASVDDSRRVAVAGGARVVVAVAGGIPNATAQGMDAARGEILARFYGIRPLLAWAGRVFYLGGYFHAVGAMLGHPQLFGSNLALRSSTWRRMSPLVHRDRVDIHDDLDLSIQLEPDMSVLYDPQLHVRVSGRQLTSWSSLRRHLAWSANTFAPGREKMSLAARRRRRRVRTAEPSR